MVFARADGEVLFVLAHHVQGVVQRAQCTAREKVTFGLCSVDVGQVAYTALCEL